jgi:hypothetical protein
LLKSGKSWLSSELDSQVTIIAAAPTLMMRGRKPQGGSAISLKKKEFHFKILLVLSAFVLTQNASETTSP